MQSAIENHSSSKNKITSLFLAVTQKCNISCKYCSADAGPDKKGFLPLSEAKNSIKNWISGLEYDEATVVFTGGEPTLWGYDKLNIICQYIRQLEVKYKKKINLGIQTNGTRINSQFIEWCIEWSVNPSISLDGPYNLSDINRGLGLRTMEGLRRLQAGSVDFALILCLTRELYENLDQVLDWLEHNKCFKIRINELGAPPQGRSAEALSANEYFSAKKKIFFRNVGAPERGLSEHNMTRMLGYVDSFLKTQTVSKNHCDELLCGAGHHMAAVNPDGSWSLCVERSMTGGTINGSYDNLESNKNNFWSNKNAWEKCQTCSAKVVCDQGCVVYHQMNKSKFENQCHANKMFWNFLVDVIYLSGSDYRNLKENIHEL